MRIRPDSHFLFALSICIALLSAFARTTPGAAQAASTAQVSIQPATLAIQPNDLKEIQVQVAGIQEMYGMEFHLQFDPNLVEIVDQDAEKDGVQIAAGSLLQDGFVAVNLADNTTGKIDYAVTLLNPAPPVSGEGTVAVIQLKAKQIGSSSIRIEKAILASREGNELPSQWQDGSITVGESAPIANTPVAQNPASTDTALIAISALGIMVFLAAVVIFIAAVRKRQPS